MVKITNGIDIFEVTNGAFEGIYSHQGFTVIPKEVEGNILEKVVEDVPVKTDEEIFLIEIVEKPIAQWNKDEIKRFAALKEINLSETKNATEAKELIKAHLV